MRQLQQNLKSGATEIVDVPVPNCGAGEIFDPIDSQPDFAGNRKNVGGFWQGQPCSKGNAATAQGQGCSG